MVLALCIFDHNNALNASELLYPHIAIASGLTLSNKDLIADIISNVETFS